MEERKVKKIAQNYLINCRPGDWEHALRVVKWVKLLGKNRPDLETLVLAAYIHDIGWYKILPSDSVISKEELKRFEPLANSNTLQMVGLYLSELEEQDISEQTILRLIKAADEHHSELDDEAIIVDADNLSKLCIEHVSEKYQRQDWAKMVKLWEEEFPNRIKSEIGKKTYPELIDLLKSEIKTIVG